MKDEQAKPDRLTQEQQQELALAAARIQIALLRYEIESEKCAPLEEKKRKLRL